MAFIDWKDSYSVQIKEIDDQHKVLVDLINELHASMKERKSKDVLKGILDKLADYTIYHFGTEENYFEQFNYSDTVAHVDMHFAFVKKITDFIIGFDAGKMFLSMELMDFLNDWLISHICTEDPKYVSLFHENGIE